MTPETLLACHDQGRLWSAGQRGAGPMQGLVPPKEAARVWFA